MSENPLPELIEPTDTAKRVRAGKLSTRKIEHFVAPLEETPLQSVDKVDETAEPLSMWAQAWRSLRTRPLFIISALLIILVVTVAAFPGLFTQTDPTACSLSNARKGPEPGHPLGFTFQGCDIYARIIFGTRASVLVGLFTTIAVVIIGGTFGALAGYYGGWLDSVLARLGDIFFALPLILGAIVIMQLPAFRDSKSIWTVIITSDDIRMAAVGPHHPRCRHRGKECGLCHGLAVAWALKVQDAGQARAAQFPGADHRGGHDFPGYLHRGRGHVVLPGRWTCQQAS